MQHNAVVLLQWFLSFRPYNLITLSWKGVPSVLWLCWLGGRRGIWPVKNWVVGHWRGYLSGARCRLAYMAQLMPLLLTVSCFSKIQIGFTFLVPAHPGSPVCVCVCLSWKGVTMHSVVCGLLLPMFLGHYLFAGHIAEPYKNDYTI